MPTTEAETTPNGPSASGAAGRAERNKNHPALPLARTNKSSPADLPKSFVVTTERLRLRLPRQDDAPTIAEHMGDRDVAAQGMGLSQPYSVTQAVEWVSRAQAHWAEGTSYAFVIEARATQALLGAVSIRLVGPLSKSMPGWTGLRRGDLGYWLGRAHWGKGLAPEAILGLTPLIQDRLQLSVLEASVYGENTRSIRVLQKLGFTSLGTASLRVSDSKGAHAIHRFRKRVG